MGIILKGIHKTFKGRKVIEDLNLSVKKGDFHVLLGESGSGKTTILSIISGLVRQDQGEVFIGSAPAGRLAPEARKVGFVFQNHALFPHLSVFENVAFGLRIRKCPKDRIHQWVEQGLERIGIAEEKDKFPHQLSGGQQQRVALIRALITRPDVLLMDEPMSHLDPIVKDRIIRDLKALQQELETTILCVTHNHHEALCLGNCISVLNQGKIEQAESADEIFCHPKTRFVARLVGAVNIVHARVIELSENEARLCVANAEVSRPIVISAKRYPIFAKKQCMDLSIHPRDFLIKRPEDENFCRQMNRVEGIVVDRQDNGPMTQVCVDVGGLILHAAAPKPAFSCAVKEPVALVFAPDALRPLCGKSCRSSESQRICMGNGHENSIENGGKQGESFGSDDPAGRVGGHSRHGRSAAPSFFD